MRHAAQTLASGLGVAPACRALGVPRSQWYRARPRASAEPARSRALPSNAAARALSAEERATVLAVLNSPRFVDQAPREVYARLLDEGRHLCSWRQMYRVLAAHAQVVNLRPMWLSRILCETGRPARYNGIFRDWHVLEQDVSHWLPTFFSPTRLSCAWMQLRSTRTRLR